MKIISLWNPYAVLWAGGKKKIETRGKNWFSNCLLPLWVAVHAAKKWNRELRDTSRQEPFRSALHALGYADPDKLPFGAVVGVVRIIRIYQFSCDVAIPDGDEAHFGDFYEGRFGYVTDRNYTFEKPIPLAGSQGAFNWTPPAVAKLIDHEALPTMLVPLRDQLSMFEYVTREGGIR